METSAPSGLAFPTHHLLHKFPFDSQPHSSPSTMPVISMLTELTSRSNPVIQPPLTDSSFKIDFSGLAGFFGGDSAWKALASMCLFHPSDSPSVIFGLNNSPGVYEVVKRCAPIANSTLWDALFPGSSRDPAEVLGVEVETGPPSLHVSGCTTNSGHPAYLLAQEAYQNRQDLLSFAESPFSTTIVNLSARSSAAHATVAPLGVDRSVIRLIPIRSSQNNVDEPGLIETLLWTLPSCGSIVPCIICALVRDWWCFASILVGIYAGAWIRLALFTGSLIIVFKDPMPALGSHPEMEREVQLELHDGHPTQQEDSQSPEPHEKSEDGGMLLHEKGVIVLRGNKTGVSALTRGHFHVKFPFPDVIAYLVGAGLWSLMIQFVAQLMLVPQGTLFGQLMFITSLAISFILNIFLAANQKKWQTQYLLDLCGLEKSSFKETTMGSKAGQAVFACLALRHLPGYAPRELLNRLVPDSGNAWVRWKYLVARKLESWEPPVEFKFSEAEKHPDDLNLTETELSNLARWLEDAEEACSKEGWKPQSTKNEKAADETPKEGKEEEEDRSRNAGASDEPHLDSYRNEAVDPPDTDEK